MSACVALGGEVGNQEAVVHEKFKLRNDSCLFADLFSEDKTDTFVFFCQALQNLFRQVRREDTKVNPSI